MRYNDSSIPSADAVSGSLTCKEAESFFRDGFVIARSILSERDLYLAISDIRKLHKGAKSGKLPDVYYEEAGEASSRRQIRQAECIPKNCPNLLNLSYDKRLLQIARQLLGEEAILFKRKLNLKLPGGDGYPPHRDGHFRWITRDGDRVAGWSYYAPKFINAFISLDYSTCRNGCLQVAPGRHVLVKSHSSVEADYLNSLNYVPCESAPGDVTFFDADLPHKSDRNNTDSPRRVFCLTYHAKRYGDNFSRYLEDKRFSLERGAVNR